MTRAISIRPDVLAFAEMIEIRLRIHDKGNQMAAQTGLEDVCSERALELEDVYGLPDFMAADLAAQVASLALAKFLQHHETGPALEQRRNALEEGLS